jgi:hypothetical protein
VLGESPRDALRVLAAAATTPRRSAWQCHHSSPARPGLLCLCSTPGPNSIIVCELPVLLPCPCTLDWPSGHSKLSWTVRVSSRCCSSCSATAQHAMLHRARHWQLLTKRVRGCASCVFVFFVISSFSIANVPISAAVRSTGRPCTSRTRQFTINHSGKHAA